MFQQAPAGAISVTLERVYGGRRGAVADTVHNDA